MTSPITYLDTSKYSRAHIRMMASAHALKIPASEDGSTLRQAQDASLSAPAAKDAATPAPTEATAQLFWSTTEFGMSGERSVTFKVYLDSKWHDYELDLKSNPNWKGLTDRLRLDPVDMAGVDVFVDEIWLAE